METNTIYEDAPHFFASRFGLHFISIYGRGLECQPVVRFDAGHALLYYIHFCCGRRYFLDARQGVMRHAYTFTDDDDKFLPYYMVFAFSR